MIQQGIDITAVIAEDKLQHIVFMEQSEIKVYPAFVIIHKAGLSGYIFDDSAAVSGSVGAEKPVDFHSWHFCMGNSNSRC